MTKVAARIPEVTPKYYLFNFEFESTPRYSGTILGVSVAQAVARARGAYSKNVLKNQPGTPKFSLGVNQAKELRLTLSLSILTIQKYKELYRVAYQSKYQLEPQDLKEFSQLTKITEDIKKWN